MNSLKPKAVENLLRKAAEEHFPNLLADIKVGSFSRGGYSRQHKEGLDHDFDPDVILGLFGFFLPEHDDTHFFFSKSKITADFIVDALEILWIELKKTYPCVRQ